MLFKLVGWDLQGQTGRQEMTDRTKQIKINMEHDYVALILRLVDGGYFTEKEAIEKLYGVFWNTSGSLMPTMDELILQNL